MFSRGKEQEQEEKTAPLLCTGCPTIIKIMTMIEVTYSAEITKIILDGVLFICFLLQLNLNNDKDNEDEPCR